MKKKHCHWKGQSHPPTHLFSPLAFCPCITAAQPFTQLCSQQLREPTQFKSTSWMLLQEGRMQEFRQGKDTTPSIDMGNILRGSWNFKDPQFSFGSYRPDLCNETQLHSKLFHKSMQVSVTHYLTSESAFLSQKTISSTLADSLPQVLAALY